MRLKSIGQVTLTEQALQALKSKGKIEMYLRTIKSFILPTR